MRWEEAVQAESDGAQGVSRRGARGRMWARRIASRRCGALNDYCSDSAARGAWWGKLNESNQFDNMRKSHSAAHSRRGACHATARATAQLSNQTRRPAHQSRATRDIFAAAYSPSWAPGHEIKFLYFSQHFFVAVELHSTVFSCWFRRRPRIISFASIAKPTCLSPTAFLILFVAVTLHPIAHNVMPPLALVRITELFLPICTTLACTAPSP